MWSKADCQHYVKYDNHSSKPTERWYVVESRHRNGLMKISRVNCGTENVEETIEKVKSNHHSEMDKEMLDMNAEKLASSVADDLYESLPADFLDKFAPDKKEISKINDDNDKLGVDKHKK